MISIDSGYLILTQDEIDHYVRQAKVVPQKIKGHRKEKYRQVVINGVYLPYLISSYGRVISLRYRGFDGKVAVMKPTVGSNGYLRTTLEYKTIKYHISIHRLVAMTFVKNPDNKPDVNHIDGVKTNPCAWNLEWVTKSENTRHAIRNSLMKIRRGEEIGDNKFTENMVRQVCELLVENKLTHKEIAEKTGVSREMVRHIRRGYSWKHISREYDFRYYNNGKHRAYNRSRIMAIRKICKMLESGDYTLEEISEETGYSYSMIHKISTGERWGNISKDYNVSNYWKQHEV